MKIFAISDQHFGHQNIIKYCNREHSTAVEDAKSMIIAHNETVTDEDLVIFCGDVSASAQGVKWLPKIIAKLKGRKILVRGNHDHQKSEKYIEMGFESVHDVLVIDKFCFCHYPDHPDVIRLCLEQNLTLCCGHTHKPFKDYGDRVPRINLAVDVIGKKPILITEI